MLSRTAFTMRRMTSSMMFRRSFASAPQAAEAFSGVTSESLGLNKLGLNLGDIKYNLSYEELAEHEKKNNEGTFVNNGTFAVDTGKFTGRSPKDKWIVKQGPSEDKLWWGDVNQPISPEIFDELYEKTLKHYEGKEAYVFDGYCGANMNSRRNVRFVTELAWQQHFVRNMFIRPEDDADMSGFAPDFTIINACKIVNEDWEKHGLNSEVFVAFNLEKKVAVIGGTWYGGEMKKGIFSMMNYWLPEAGHLPMHCSANVGKEGDSAVFFGLSGTGKTTLSADPKRFLIGDDEHGWDDDGIFNFEGGCYAKTIKLSPETEPEIYNAIKRDAMLENVMIKDGEPDYFDVSKTQNGRVSYPIHHIPNYLPAQQAGHPDAMIFLTCDAYGVLPPVSKLSNEQAMYHFLSGYTAKVAGTERGVTEPEATFSACFGAAFLTRHPTEYAKLLGEKLGKHKTRAYLVNTGWTGGAYGVGERMNIPDTRACIDAILDGSIENSSFTEHPQFKVGIPDAVPGVKSEILDPKNTWSDKAAYDETANKLANQFIENYKKYQTGDVEDFSAHGPTPSA